MVATASRPWRYAVVLAAVGQLVSPTLVFGLGSGAVTSSSTDTPITPPGWTFVVWGVICLLSLAYAVYQRPGGATGLDPVLERLARPLAFVFVLFSLWLAVAELDVVWLTVVVFTGMLVGLLRAGRIALGSAELARTRGPRLLVCWLLGTYTGWTSVAVFVNLSAAVRQQGAPVSSTVGLAWQAVLLLAAVLLSVAVTFRWRAPWPYVLTVVWALLGAATATYQHEARPLTVVCALGVVAVLAVAVLIRSGHRPGAPRSARVVAA